MLSDCITRERSAAELFIVCGDTIGTFARATRDRQAQGVLLLGPGIVGLQEASLEEALDSEDFKGLIAALGIGICLCGEGRSRGCLSLDLLRYGRIILVAEETRPGSSFITTVLSLLHRFMNPIVASGVLFASSVSPQALVSEAEFEKRVMNAATRSLRMCGIA